MSERNYGLLLPTIEIEKDYVLGGYGSLGGEILQSDGQWLVYLGTNEQQRNYGFDCQGCASFGTNHAIQVLARRLFGETDNFSDRYLAKASGTTETGNDPHKVAETVRKMGAARESDYPITSDLTSWESFYGAIPARVLTLALEFVAKYDFKHEYVPTTPTQLKRALQYSPLGISVSAWQKDPKTGLYISPFPNNHWVTLIGYVDGKHWIVWDSYGEEGEFTKKLAWNHQFAIAKRYALKKNADTASPGWIAFIINLVLSAFGLKDPNPQPVEPAPAPLPPPPPAPAEPKKDYLGLMCQAIQKHEGWYVSSRSWRNCNPGNCKFSSVGYDPMYGVVKKDKDGFAIFSSVTLGTLYLRNLIKAKAKGNPSQSLVNFMKVYAPSSDNNDPIRYATVVGQAMGVNPYSFTMGQVLS